MTILTTKRLILRDFADTDLDALMHVFGDPEVMHFGTGVQNREWVREWLKTCRTLYQTLGYGPWAVEERRTALLIGYCGLFHFPALGGREEVEVGYRLARSAWGQGFATEAVKAVREHAFDVLGLRRLVAMIDPHNHASVRVARKAGLKFEKQVMLEGYSHPDHLYVIERNKKSERRKTFTMKAIEIKIHGHSPKPPEEICASIIDTQRWPEFAGYAFLPGIAHAEFENKTAEVVGSRIKVQNTDGSSHVEEILEWEVQRKIVLRFQDFSPPLSRMASHFIETWEFRPAADGTEVSRAMTMFPKNFMGWLVLLPISRLMKKAFEASRDQLG